MARKKSPPPSSDATQSPAPPAAGELQRLRDRVELQFRQLETLNRALSQLAGGSAAAIVAPVLPQPAERWPQETVPLLDAESWWPSSDRPAEPLVPTPGLACLSLAGSQIPVTAIIVFGLQDEALASVVHMISARQRRSLNFRPVFLTSSPDFSVFRSLGYAFEYLPEAVYGTQPHFGGTVRAQARMRLLQQKWAFDSTIDLTARGAGADAGSGLTATDDVDAAPPTPAATTLDEQIALIRSSGLFDEAWYRERHPEIGAADPIRHYLAEGAAKGFDPSPLFLTAFYARQMMKRDG